MTIYKWAWLALTVVFLVVGLWAYARASRYQLAATNSAVWVMDTWSGEMCGTAGGDVTCYRNPPAWEKRDIDR